MDYPLNHLVVMVTNINTGRLFNECERPNDHRNIMECNTDESYFLNLESEDLDRLESLADSYFSTRENEEVTSDSDSDSSSDDENDNDNFNFREADVELMEVHMTERAKVENFYEETCHCKLGEDEKACSLSLTINDFIESRNNCKELSSTELDLVILGIIQSSLNCNETSVSGRVEKARQHARMEYFYHGKRICMKTFLFLHCIHNNRFYSLVKQEKWFNFTCPWKCKTAVERVVKFIKNTAEEQALLLPGHVPGFKRIDVKLLPSNLTKHGLWKRYAEICASMFKSLLDILNFVIYGSSSVHLF